MLHARFLVTGHGTGGGWGAALWVFSLALNLGESPLSSGHRAGSSDGHQRERVVLTGVGVRDARRKGVFVNCLLLLLLDVSNWSTALNVPSSSEAGQHCDLFLSILNCSLMEISLSIINLFWGWGHCRHVYYFAWNLSWFSAAFFWGGYAWFSLYKMNKWAGLLLSLLPFFPFFFFFS